MGGQGRMFRFHSLFVCLLHLNHCVREISGENSSVAKPLLEDSTSGTEIAPHRHATSGPDPQLKLIIDELWEEHEASEAICDLIDRMMVLLPETLPSQRYIQKPITVFSECHPRHFSRQERAKREHHLRPKPHVERLAEVWKVRS